MPKYQVSYGFEVPAYGHVYIEAATDEEVMAEVNRRWKDDTLMDSWDTHADCGCSNYRVLAIHNENTDRGVPNSAFSLEEDEDE